MNLYYGLLLITYLIPLKTLAMKIKTIIIIICSFFAITGCSQNNNKKTNTKKEIQKFEKTVDNILKDTYKSIKSLSIGNHYEISVSSKFCDYSIFINDLPYQPQKSGEINSYIYKEGEQKIEFTIKPKSNFKVFTNELLNDPFAFKIDISELKKDEKYKEELTVFHLSEISMEEKQQILNDTLYKNKLTFVASLPSELHNWFDSEDLRLSSTIEQDVVLAYKEIARLYKENNYKQLTELYEPLLFNKAAQNCKANKYNTNMSMDFFYNNIMKEVIPETVTLFNSNTNLILRSDYKIRFYSKGRLITLETSANVPALEGKYTQQYFELPEGKSVFDGDISESDFKYSEKEEKIGLILFFHKPKGAKNLKLLKDYKKMFD